MHRILEQYLDALDCAGTEQQLRNAMAVLAGNHGLYSFAYLCLPRALDRKICLISTYSEQWTSHYSKQNYHLFDPVIVQAKRCGDPFNWGADFGKANVQNRTFFRQAADFGIHCGHTVPIRNWRGCSAAMTFASDRQKPQFSNSIRHNAGLLRFLSVHFHGRVQDLTEPGFMTDGISLSVRQVQCLEWTLRGKTIGEIAQILSITRATAAYHLDCARKKFGVRTVAQALAAYVIVKERRKRG